MATQTTPPVPAAYTTLELLTPAGPEHRLVSTAPPRPATRDEIPVIDLRGMRFGGTDAAEEKRRVAAAIRAAATGSGFFYVENHGIPEEVIAAAQRQARRFFAQPAAEKMRVWSRLRPRGNGYSPPGSGRINRSEGRDEKEAFQFRYQPEYDPQPPADLADPSPDGPPPPEPEPQGDEWIWEQTAHLDGFKEATLDWWARCLTLARGLARLFALALDLPEDYFDAATTRPGSDGLYIHYPGGTSSSAEKKAADDDVDVPVPVGIGSHTDMQCFTLLWQDASGGLQVLSPPPRSEWLEATPLPGTLVVNIADFLQRLSNDVFRSTVHRVYNRSGGSRYSMPFFFGFNLDAVCAVVPTCCGEGNPARYGPISCGKWRDERFALATVRAREAEAKE